MYIFVQVNISHYITFSNSFKYLKADAIMENQNLMLLVSPDQLRTSVLEAVEEALDKHHAKTNGAKFYNKREAAERLGVGITSIYNWLREGKLKGRKIGSRVLFTEEDLENCLKEWSKYERVQR